MLTQEFLIYKNSYIRYVIKFSDIRRLHLMNFLYFFFVYIFSPGAAIILISYNCDNLVESLQWYNIKVQSCNLYIQPIIL